MLSDMPLGTIARFADSDTIAGFMDGFSVTRIAMFVTSIVIGLFAVFLMYSFITIGLINKRRNISILRSMGARTTDVMKIFMIEAVILAIFVLACAVGLAFSGMAIGNFAVQHITGNSLTLFASGWLFWVTVLGGAFVVIMASYLLPVWKLARRNKRRGVIGGMKGRSEV